MNVFLATFAFARTQETATIFRHICNAGRWEQRGGEERVGFVVKCWLDNFEAYAALAGWIVGSVVTPAGLRLRIFRVRSFWRCRSSAAVGVLLLRSRRPCVLFESTRQVIRKGPIRASSKCRHVCG